MSWPSRISMPCDGSGLAGGRAEHVAGDQVERGAPRQLEPVAVVDEFVAQHLVVHGGRGRGIAAAVVAGEHHAGAAAIGDDAAVVDGVAARAMDQHADAEVADLQPADVDALGVDQRKAGQGGGADIGAELAGDRAGAGLRPLVLDVAGAVDRNERAGLLPRRAFDRHRPLDRRQRRRRLDHVRTRTARRDLDAETSGRGVVALDRPAQRSLAAVVGGAGDVQHVRRGRSGRDGLGAGVGGERQQRQRRNDFGDGICAHVILPRFLQLLSARIRVANASVHLRTRVGKACGRRRRDADCAPRMRR